MIRILIALLAVVLFLILTLPLLLILQIVGLFNKDSKAGASQAVIKWAFKLLLFICGTKVSVYGKENVPDDRSVLFVGNHRSIFDILILYVNTKMPTGIVSKKEMGRVPIFNIWMKNIGCLFLDRDDIKQGLKTILTAVDMAKSGMCMAIFPEGTRNKTEEICLPFKGGSFKIAEKSGCDVIPFTVVGSSAIFEDHKPFVKKAKVVLAFGEPIKTEGLKRDELKLIPEKARQSVIDMHEKHVAEIK
ncbi:MAG: 1-acyl-sn-glycerol-3-phosphate acyltransferase [Lachnospiraceae bacterium]|nr:1-acyl-sn-glycerol-3-phosphate acyltransferase [Lachnospiraceae bacterium]